MKTIDLSADCARCAALCCVALAFDRSALFGFDKAAGAPCPNLDRTGGCVIHAERVRRGFSGCVDYDCLGAGPRVTQMFGGQDWLGDSALLGRMTEAFSAVQRAHRLLVLLRQAKTLNLPCESEHRRAQLEAEVEDAGAATEAISRLEARAHRYLQGLRAFVPARTP